MENQNENVESLNQGDDLQNQNLNEQSEPIITPDTVETPADEPVAEPEAETPQAENVEQPIDNAQNSVTESPVEASTDLSTSENEVLSQVKAQIMDGSVLTIIPQAQSSELVLLMEQLVSIAGSLDIKSANEVAKTIKEHFDKQQEAGAVSHELQERFSTFSAKFNKFRNEQKSKNEESSISRKKDIISSLSDMLDSGILNHNTVKELQAEWKTLAVFAKDVKEELESSFKTLTNKYYQRKSQEVELLNYDRERNLKSKTEIIEKIRALLPSEEDALKQEFWKEKSETLAEFTKTWKEIGQVPKEDMDRINLEYKDVVDNFYAQRKEFYNSQETGQGENGEKKEALLEKMQVYTAFTAEKSKAWEEATKELIALQEEWKAIGKAPAEKNSELWKRFREVGNAFFGNKSEFFKNLEAQRMKNVEIKEALCVRAEALKDNTDWEKAANEIKKLQEEWKASGPVPEKLSNKLWNRFRTACDAFFTARRDHYKDIKGEEENNLTQKRSLIEEVKTLIDKLEDERDEAVTRAKEIQAVWKTIGKVPIKFKDSIWDDFRAVVDEFFNALRSAKPVNRTFKSGGNQSDRRNSGTGDDKQPPHMQDKIKRLKMKIQKVEEKISQYETNILYISKGKSGDALRAQIQAEIDKEQAFVNEWRKQIKDLQNILANPGKEAEVLSEITTADDTEEIVMPEGLTEDETVAETETATEETATEETVAEAPIEETKAEDETEA